ncbi:MAG: cob(I)yrinic acid a,c-diamide adenosyltransferase [Puniceicoccales bacterium]|jgi:cob(I)alamin adenosyltransferase|nr:cob(I)yrinic acid a,c-diamide adenosyltransferase [Puniceicoccales bacterium]
MSNEPSPEQSPEQVPEEQPDAAGSASEHRAKMQALKDAMGAKIRAATERRDLVIVHTGDGKGKSTAAFGMLARNVGRRRKSVVVQFVKAGDTAVRDAFAGDFLEWHFAGGGFTWDTQNRDADAAHARAGWEIALAALRDPAARFVVLDELNIVLACDCLPVSEVIAGLRGRAAGKHVVITGRNAPPELIEFADLVTEFREVKHPFADGVRAQEGVEF